MIFELPAHLEAKVTRVPFSSCWYWTGAMDGSGYGHLQVRSAKRMVGAHRASYEATIGPIPAGHDIDHLCRTRCCVNPAHLEPVTRKENLERAGIIEAINAIARRRGAQTHCKRGHPLSGDNLYLYPSGGGRVCRACRRKSTKEAA